jgi:hypothetical protein
MTAKSETVGVGRSGWAAALKAQLRLMTELESRFKSGNSVPVERTYITAAEFAVIETYMEEDEALSTDLGMLNLRKHEQLQSLLSGLEALAGEMEKDAANEWYHDGYRNSCRRYGADIRALIPAAANTESEE